MNFWRIILYKREACYLIFILGYLAVITLACIAMVIGVTEANMPLSSDEQLIHSLGLNPRPRAWWPIGFGLYMTINGIILVCREIRSFKCQKSISKLEKEGNDNFRFIPRAVLFAVITMSLVAIYLVFPAALSGSFGLLVLSASLLGTTLSASRLLEVVSENDRQ